MLCHRPLDPRDSIGHSFFISVLLARSPGWLGEPDRAIAYFTKAIELDSTYMIAYHNRSVAHRKLGHDVKAAADLARTTELGYERDDE